MDTSSQGIASPGAQRAPARSKGYVIAGAIAEGEKPRPDGLLGAEQRGYVARRHGARKKAAAPVEAGGAPANDAVASSLSVGPGGTVYFGTGPPSGLL